MALLLAVSAACSPSPAATRTATAPLAAATNLVAWPGNPCAVLTPQEVAAAPGIRVTRARRTASIAKVVHREAYFATFPGSARKVAGLREDTWIGGGAALRVLVRDDLWFAVATQTAGERSPEILVALARAVLARF